MKHEFLVEVTTDDRYSSKQGREMLQEMIAGRAWSIDGVSKNGAAAKIVGHDVVVISMAEYEQLKAKVAHYEKDSA